MEVEFSPEQERRLREMSERAGISPARLVALMIGVQLEYDERFKTEIDQGLRSVNWLDAMRADEARRRADAVVRALWSFAGSNSSAE